MHGPRAFVVRLQSGRDLGDLILLTTAVLSWLLPGELARRDSTDSSVARKNSSFKGNGRSIEVVEISNL